MFNFDGLLVKFCLYEAMAEGQVKNFYVITILGSNENVVIPDSWICRREGGAIIASLPVQYHEQLATIDGPVSLSRSLKYGQIERGFDNYSEASNYLNQTEKLQNRTAKLKSSEISNSKTINRDRSELEALLRDNTNLQSKVQNKSLPEISLKNSSQLETSRKEPDEFETLLNKPEASPSKICLKLSVLEEESTNTDVLSLNFADVVESTVSATLHAESACSSEQQTKKHVPGLVPIKSLHYLAIRKPVNPLQTAQVTTLDTPLVQAASIVLNKSANIDAESGLKGNSNVKLSCETSAENKAAEQEAQRTDINRDFETTVDASSSSRAVPSGSFANNQTQIQGTAQQMLIDRDFETTVDAPSSSRAVPSGSFANNQTQIQGTAQQMFIDRDFETTVEASSSSRAVPSGSFANNQTQLQGTAQQMLIENIPRESMKLPQNVPVTDMNNPNELNEESSKGTEFLDCIESVDAAKEYLLKMNFLLNQNLKRSTLTKLCLKSHLPFLTMKPNPTTVATVEQLCESTKNNIHERNPNIDARLDKVKTTTDLSASASSSDVMAICTTTLIQNRDFYSSKKKTQLRLILHKLEAGLSIFENLKQTRDNLSASLKVILRTTIQTRKRIQQCLKMAKPTFKRTVLKEIKPRSSINKVSCMKKIVKYMPKVLDLEDKWTLKYKEQKRGTVELIENSHIFVNKKGLAKCKKEATDYKHLGRLLMHEVFTAHALNRCSVTTGKTRTRPDGYRRPGLNKAGIKTLCDFVETYRPTKKEPRLYVNWRPVDRKVLRMSISRYLYNRRRY